MQLVVSSRKDFFHYLKLTRIGSERRISGKVFQTPYKYENVLQSQLTEVSDEMSSITKIFVEAFYIKIALSEGHVEWVRMLWGHMPNSFRKKTLIR